MLKNLNVILSPTILDCGVGVSIENFYDGSPFLTSYTDSLLTLISMTKTQHLFINIFYFTCPHYFFYFPIFIVFVILNFLKI